MNRFASQCTSSMAPSPMTIQITELVLPGPAKDTTMIGRAQASIMTHIIFESC